MRARAVATAAAVSILAHVLAGCRIPSAPSEPEDQTLPDDAGRLAVGNLIEIGELVRKGSISEDDFVQQFAGIMADVDRSAANLASFRSYLGGIAGRSIPAVSSTAGTAPALLRRPAAGNASLWEQITNSTAYKQLEAFVSAAIFANVSEPGGSLLQVANPQTFVTLSTVQVRTHILQAQYSGRISVEKANELLAINSTNPYDAERELLSAQGRPIPDWLQKAPPEACLGNCALLSGRYVGTFNNGGSFTRVANGVTCTWHEQWDGAVDLSLTIGSDNGASGSVRVYGNRTETLVSGPSGACIVTSGAFNDTRSVSGSAAVLSWSTDLYPTGIISGTFLGEVKRSTVQGTITTRYAFGSGSPSWDVTLYKQ